MIAVSCVALLSACDDGARFMSDSVGIVTVDGYRVEVKRNRADPLIWEAAHMNPIKLRLNHGDPKAYARNVRAIEQVSGCKADRDNLNHIATIAATVAGVTC
tara:strand:- start:119 stop:424 length:306 start_codon:yes stop_codon:yes gene_type:complete